MQNMTDEKLYELCKKFGKMVLEARRKFAGLLPEVYKRRLYEKKGFSSLFEFAAKLAGMSKEQVNLVLKLERKFEDKPVLQNALTSGEISANKLVRIVSIATKENQGELLETVKVLSNRAVEVFVRDVRKENLDGFTEPLFAQESMHVHRLKLDEDVEEKLLEMQEKGIDVNEFLRNALKKREEDIKGKKNEIKDEQEQKLNKEKEGLAIDKQISPSRYIPSKIKKIITEEHGTKCSYPGCANQAKTLHHTQRFALTHNHDPHFIAPLCEAHHEIAHKIDAKYMQKTCG